MIKQAFSIFKQHLYTYFWLASALYVVGIFLDKNEDSFLAFSLYMLIFSSLFILSIRFTYLNIHNDILLIDMFTDKKSFLIMLARLIGVFVLIFILAILICVGLYFLFLVIQAYIFNSDVFLNPNDVFVIKVLIQMMFHDSIILKTNKGKEP